MPPAVNPTLADLGVKLNKDGTFTLNTTTLATALSNGASAVASMFTSGVNGSIPPFSHGERHHIHQQPIAVRPITQYSSLQSRLTDKESSIAAAGHAARQVGDAICRRQFGGGLLQLHRIVSDQPDRAVEQDGLSRKECDTCWQDAAR
jgi:hypothetical protein